MAAPEAQPCGSPRAVSSLCSPAVTASDADVCLSMSLTPLSSSADVEHKVFGSGREIAVPQLAISASTTKRIAH
eukprot:633664-Prymnesium_polylepis.1